MIELNLVPDVKQELIKAKHVRTMVVSGAIVVGIASVGIVVLLAVYLFGVQQLRSTLADKKIDEQSAKLEKVPDLANMLTIQSQLASISELHSQKNIGSRLFDVLTAINPAKPNQVVLSMVKVDSATKTVHIDAQATNGFLTADVFKKTILATKFSYDNNGETATEPLADDVTISNLSYGEDADGAKVLRFSIDFVYKDALFAYGSGKVALVRPDKQNATDSYKFLPEALFGTRAADIKGNN